MSPFAKGVASTIVLLIVVTLAAVVLGAIPAGADAKPSALERWAARLSLGAALLRESKSVEGTFPATQTDLSTAVKLYAANCAVCHGASDARP